MSIAVIEVETQRLKLRQWHPEDRVPFRALNADPQVMAFFPAVLDSMRSDQMADACERLIAERDWGLWALELKSSGEFIGMLGLHVPTAALPFAPCVEIGWRLALSHWGQGYATEAGKAALRVGFEQLALGEIVSFTTVMNQRSRLLMERLGMLQEPGTFDHPTVMHLDTLRKHVLYRLTRDEWGRLAHG